MKKAKKGYGEKLQSARQSRASSRAGRRRRSTSKSASSNSSNKLLCDAHCHNKCAKEKYPTSGKAKLTNVRSQSLPTRPPTRRKPTDMPNPVQQPSLRAQSSGPPSGRFEIGQKPRSTRLQNHGNKPAPDYAHFSNACRLYAQPPSPNISIVDPNSVLAAEANSLGIPVQKKPTPTPRKHSKKRDVSYKKRISEHEYLQFSLRITEDIIRNDLYTNEEMRRVFNSHLEANRGRLDMDKMHKQIEHLCQELNIPPDDVQNDETPAINQIQTAQQNAKTCICGPVMTFPTVKDGGCECGTIRSLPLECHQHSASVPEESVDAKSSKDISAEQRSLGSTSISSSPHLSHEDHFFEKAESVSQASSESVLKEINVLPDELPLYERRSSRMRQSEGFLQLPSLSCVTEITEPTTSADTVNSKLVSSDGNIESTTEFEEPEVLLGFESLEADQHHSDQQLTPSRKHFSLGSYQSDFSKKSTGSGSNTVKVLTSDIRIDDFELLGDDTSAKSAKLFLEELDHDNVVNEKRSASLSNGNSAHSAQQVQLDSANENTLTFICCCNTPHQLPTGRYLEVVEYCGVCIQSVEESYCTAKVLPKEGEKKCSPMGICLRPPQAMENSNQVLLLMESKQLVEGNGEQNNSATVAPVTQEPSSSISGSQQMPQSPNEAMNLTSSNQSSKNIKEVSPILSPNTSKVESKIEKSSADKNSAKSLSAETVPACEKNHSSKFEILEVIEPSSIRVRGSNNEEKDFVLIPGCIYIPKTKYLESQEAMCVAACVNYHASNDKDPNANGKWLSPKELNPKRFSEQPITTDVKPIYIKEQDFVVENEISEKCNRLDSDMQEQKLSFARLKEDESNVRSKSSDAFSKSNQVDSGMKERNQSFDMSNSLSVELQQENTSLKSCASIAASINQSSLEEEQQNASSTSIMSNQRRPKIEGQNVSWALTSILNRVDLETNQNGSSKMSVLPVTTSNQRGFRIEEPNVSPSTSIKSNQLDPKLSKQNSSSKRSISSNISDQEGQIDQNESSTSTVLNQIDFSAVAERPPLKMSVLPSGTAEQEQFKVEEHEPVVSLASISARLNQLNFEMAQQNLPKDILCSTSSKSSYPNSSKNMFVPSIGTQGDDGTTYSAIHQSALQTVHYNSLASTLSEVAPVPHINPIFDGQLFSKKLDINKPSNILMPNDRHRQSSLLSGYETPRFFGPTRFATEQLNDYDLTPQRDNNSKVAGNKITPFTSNNLSQNGVGIKDALLLGNEYEINNSFDPAQNDDFSNYDNCLPHALCKFYPSSATQTNSSDWLVPGSGNTINTGEKSSDATKESTTTKSSLGNYSSQVESKPRLINEEEFKKSFEEMFDKQEAKRLQLQMEKALGTNIQHLEMLNDAHRKSFESITDNTHMSFFMVGGDDKMSQDKLDTLSTDTSAFNHATGSKRHSSVKASKDSLQSRRSTKLSKDNIEHLSSFVATGKMPKDKRASSSSSRHTSKIFAEKKISLDKAGKMLQKPSQIIPPDTAKPKNKKEENDDDDSNTDILHHLDQTPSFVHRPSMMLTIAEVTHNLNNFRKGNSFDKHAHPPATVPKESNTSIKFEPTETSKYIVDDTEAKLPFIEVKQESDAHINLGKKTGKNEQDSSCCGLKKFRKKARGNAVSVAESQQNMPNVSAIPDEQLYMIDVRRPTNTGYGAERKSLRFDYSAMRNFNKKVDTELDDPLHLGTILSNKSSVNSPDMTPLASEETLQVPRKPVISYRRASVAKEESTQFVNMRRGISINNDSVVDILTGPPVPSVESMLLETSAANGNRGSIDSTGK